MQNLNTLGADAIRTAQLVLSSRSPRARGCAWGEVVNQAITLEKMSREMMAAPPREGHGPLAATERAFDALCNLRLLLSQASGRSTVAARLIGPVSTVWGTWVRASHPNIYPVA